MGKKYLDTKEGSLEQSILGLWQEAAKKQEKLDPVGKEDGDIDNDGDKDASDKYLAKRRKAISKAIKKDKKEEVEESYEIGTDEYRKHTEDVTPGENGEWTKLINQKSQSMREALAKVWGVSEGKSPFKKEEKKEDKTMTGKKIASVDINPTIKEKTK